MATVSSTTNTTNTASTTNGVYENPNAILDKDSFLKLLLVELQYQDPTEPMDSEKILTQTSQLATLESSENIASTMDELVTRLNSQLDTGVLNAIGKMASIGYNAVALDDGKASFEVYFPSEIQSGTLVISDSDGNTVKTVNLETQAGKSGVLAFNWDGYSDDGELLSDGYYSVDATYLDADGEIQETQFGVYPVESVRYEDGQTYVKLGSSYVSLEYITDFY